MTNLIVQKHWAHYDAYKREPHTKLFRLSNFRVLFVVDGSQERAANMQHVFETTVGRTIASGAFL